MKIRHGFVSNSSSSSFVISAESTDADKMMVTIDLSSFGTVIRNEKELEEFLVNEYGYDEIEDDDEKVIFARDAFSKGRIAFFGNIDNDMIALLGYLDHAKYDIFDEY